MEANAIMKRVRVQIINLEEPIEGVLLVADQSSNTVVIDSTPSAPTRNLHVLTTSDISDFQILGLADNEDKETKEPSTNESPSAAVQSQQLADACHPASSPSSSAQNISSAKDSATESANDPKEDPVELFFKMLMEVSPATDLKGPEKEAAYVDILTSFANRKTLTEESKDPDAALLQELALRAVNESIDPKNTDNMNCVIRFAELTADLAEQNAPTGGNRSAKAQWYFAAARLKVWLDIPIPLQHAAFVLLHLHDIQRGECQNVEVLSAEKTEEKFKFEVESSESALTPGRFVWTPISRVTTLADEELRRAFLSFGESGRFLCLQQELIKAVLGDLTTDIKFVRIKYRVEERPVEAKYKSQGKSRTARNAGTPNHWIMLVVFKPNGKRYAIDIFGDEFGHEDKVLDWDLFNSPPHLAAATEPMTFEEVSLQFQLGLIMSNENRFSRPADKMAIRAVKLRFEEWLRNEGTTVQELVGLGKEEFLQNLEEMCRFVHEGLRKTIQLFRKQGRFFWYLDEQGELQLTKGMDDVRKYCAKTFMDEAKKSIERLKKSGNWELL